MQQMHVSHFCRAEAHLKTLESFSTTDSDRWVNSVKSAENKCRSCRTTSLLMNTWLRMRRTHILRKHTFKRKMTWEACRLYLPWKRFFDVSSVALYPVAQVFWSWARVAATQSLTRLEVFRSARWPKLSQCLKPLKGCARSKPDLRRVDPKFQCSPLSQAKKNIVTLTKLQRVYYQLSLAALSRETGVCSGGSNWLNRSSSRQSVKTNAWFRLSFLSKLQDKSWYFYSRLRSLLACGLCTASGSSLSVACGLLLEVYIQPRPPCSKLESVRGWRTEVNETATRRGEQHAGEKCLCTRVQVWEWVCQRTEEGGI